MFGRAEAVAGVGVAVGVPLPVGVLGVETPAPPHPPIARKQESNAPREKRL